MACDATVTRRCIFFHKGLVVLDAMKSLNRFIFIPMRYKREVFQSGLTAILEKGRSFSTNLEVMPAASYRSLFFLSFFLYKKQNTAPVHSFTLLRSQDQCLAGMQTVLNAASVLQTCCKSIANGFALYCKLNRTYLKRIPNL